MPTSDTPVRVLAVSRPSEVWGAQLRLLASAAALPTRGVELALAIPAGSTFAERWAASGFECVTLPEPGSDELRDDDGNRVGPLTIASVAARALVRAFRLAPLARRYDVVLSLSRNAHFEVALAGRLARRPVVIDLVDIVRPGIGQRALQEAGHLATVVVANSRATGATVGGRARDLRVITPAVDLDRFVPGPVDPEMRARMGGRPGEPLIGILGRLDPDKGIEVVVEALSLAAGSGRHPNVARATLAVVGGKGVASDDYVERLRRASSDRLGDRVTFTGRIDDVPVVLRSLDVLVSASEAEPFGLTVLEAQTVGTPVVGAASGGVPEFVADGTTGLLFPPKDAPALADALERVLADRDLAGRMSSAARAQAVAKFSDDDILDAWAALYRELVP